MEGSQGKVLYFFTAKFPLLMTQLSETPIWHEHYLSMDGY